MLVYDELLAPKSLMDGINGLVVIGGCKGKAGYSLSCRAFLERIEIVECTSTSDRSSLVCMVELKGDLHAKNSKYFF